MEKPLNQVWEVWSVNRSEAHVYEPPILYFAGSYSACKDYVATVKSGRISKRSKAIREAQNSNKALIRMWEHLTPSTRHAKELKRRLFEQAFAAGWSK